MENLKNCPFCGGNAILRRRNPDHIMREKTFISCVKCKNKTAYYNTQEEAIAAWNKRENSAESEIHYCPHCGVKIN